MDSPQIRELERFANDFKLRRIKLGESPVQVDEWRNGVPHAAHTRLVFMSVGMGVCCSQGTPKLM